VKRSANTRTASSIRGSSAIHDRARSEAERFESLVGELSAAMAQTPAEAVDNEIEKWLAKICLALDLDRSGIYERDAPNWLVRTSHTWVRPSIPPFPKKYDPQKLLQNTTRLVLSGKRIVFSHPDEIPFDLGDAKRFVSRYGPKASAVFPMWAGGRVIGAASFGRFRSPRDWSPQLLEHLALVVRVFGAAIERKQAEQAVRLVREELALAQRRSMMGELVASLTHELNQPLGAVLSNLSGLARLVSEGNPNPALAARAVNNAIEDAKRAGEIVRRVRAMFKGNGTKKATIDVGALVSEVVGLLGSEAALRKILVEIRTPRSPLAVFGDRILLQQCVLNLLMNAFDALAKAENGKRKVMIEVAPEKSGWVAVNVHDDGPGIDPAVAGRLFEPFVTSKIDGMGLGLLVTRSIVEDHGGRVFANLDAKGGTTFTFTLPVLTEKRSSTSSRSVRKVLKKQV
jgi:signal transduction histidine kinase